MGDIREVARQTKLGDRIEVVLNEKACFDSGWRGEGVELPRFYVGSEENDSLGKLDGKRVVGYVAWSYIPGITCVRMAPIWDGAISRASCVPLGGWTVEFDAVKDARVYKSKKRCTTHT